MLTQFNRDTGLRAHDVLWLKPLGACPSRGQQRLLFGVWRLGSQVGAGTGGA